MGVCIDPLVRKRNEIKSAHLKRSFWGNGEPLRIPVKCGC